MRFSILGIIFGFICLVIAIKINYDMSIEYHTLDGKTKAFMELRYFHRLYYGVIGIIGLILGLIAIINKEKVLFVVFAILLSVLSIILSYIEVWKLMI